MRRETVKQEVINQKNEEKDYQIRSYQLKLSPQQKSNKLQGQMKKLALNTRPNRNLVTKINQEC